MSLPTITTDVLSVVREAEGEDRIIEGVAVPYGQIATHTDTGPEAFAPGAFRASVDHWMGRQDGARLAYRPAHGQPPIGSVIGLEDAPEGVRFRARIRETPAGDAYLADVRDGLNGVSVEAGLPGTSRRGKGGVVIHREARLFAIAGSVSPAYDGARIAIRDADTEDPDMPEDAQAAVTEAAPDDRDTTQITGDARINAERDVALALVGQPASGIVITRPEAVYGPRSDYSFLRDAFLAWTGDSEARERYSRHQSHLTDVSRQIERAGEVLSSEIPGAYPNDYLPGLLTPRILKGRPMGSFYQRIPISDARPKIFAKVTTSTTVAVQSAEGTNPAASDFGSTAVTATPLLYGAETVVSRQALDGADPSAQAMILQDMVEAYAQASETVIKTAVEAGSTASGVAITAATPYAGALANVINYQGTRFVPATGVFVPPAAYSVLLAQADSTGRALLPWAGPTNSDGTVRDGATGASLLNADVMLSYASTVNVWVFGRPSDFVIYESSIASFSFDAVTGPAGVRIGIWAYLVVGARLGSLKVTAA